MPILSSHWLGEFGAAVVILVCFGFEFVPGGWEKREWGLETGGLVGVRNRVSWRHSVSELSGGLGGLRGVGPLGGRSPGDMGLFRLHWG